MEFYFLKMLRPQAIHTNSSFTNFLSDFHFSCEILKRKSTKNVRTDEISNVHPLHSVFFLLLNWQIKLRLIKRPTRVIQSNSCSSCNRFLCATLQKSIITSKRKHLKLVYIDSALQCNGKTSKRKLKQQPAIAQSMEQCI